MAESGTPAAFNASAIDCARDNPRVSAADWASGSLEAASPKPVTAIVPLPRRAANAFTSSVAGCDRLDAFSTNTIVADTRADGAGIGVGTIGATGAAPAAAGRGGALDGNAGGDPASGVPALGVTIEGPSNGALWTGLRGAADGGANGGGGGAVTAGTDALAVGAVAEPATFDPVAELAANGGGAVPTPNRAGDALGDEGSANGADCAAC